MQILIADDDPISRRLLNVNLRANSHQVIEADNGLMAWELYQKNEPRLVITDWMMPEMDGPELIRHIRAANHAHYTYIIMLTALGDKANVVTGLESGADDYLTKPFHGRELKVRVAIGERIVRLEERLTEYSRQMEVLAMRDGLTNLLNRRATQEQAEAELSRARRETAPFSIILADIDHFKLVNDQHGHNNGDLALQHIAAILNQSVRAYDRVGRWGGEEFLLLLPGTKLAQAGIIAERIRGAIAAAPLDLQNGACISLRASFGVSQAPGANGDYVLLEQLVHEADQALYRAKGEGRNRVCLYAP